MEKNYDIVLLGATGFTGKLIAQYLSRHAAKDNIKIALAGRNLDHLEKVKSSLTHQNVALEIFDVKNPEDLVNLAKKTNVIMNAVGPFSFSGKNVIESCLKAKTHYLDITGEPSFVADVYKSYHEEASEAGVCIVNCCGFDSIPADITTWLTAQKLPHDQPMILDGFVRTNAEFSGGTLNTAIQMMYQEATKKSSKLKIPRHVDTPKTKVKLHFNSDMNGWAIPMPVVDPHIVKRSIYKLPLDYGYATAYRQFFVRSTFFKMLKTVLPVLIASLLIKSKRFRDYMKNKYAPGTGPSPEKREQSFFEFTCIGSSGTTKVTTRMKGGDPGYNETSKMFSEAAFTLLHKSQTAQLKVGVCTPVEALGQELVDRLTKQGIVIQQEIS